MNEYVISEIVKAEQMTRQEYNNYRGWILPSNECGDDNGFHVVRSNGHESWFPKETFEKIAIKL